MVPNQPIMCKNCILKLLHIFIITPRASRLVSKSNELSIRTNDIIDSVVAYPQATAYPQQVVAYPQGQFDNIIILRPCNG